LSILTQIATTVAQSFTETGAEVLFALSVYEHALSDGKEDEAGAVKRLADFYAIPLSDLSVELNWFDVAFPHAKTALQVPGRERSFWSSTAAYNAWRRKVRRRIEFSSGAVAAEQERRGREDGWTELLAVLAALSKDGGPIHSAELGAVTKLADRARKENIEPDAFSKETIDRLLASARSPEKRRKIVRSLQVLERYSFIQSIAQHIPRKLEIDAARRRFEMCLPEHVNDWIDGLVEKAAYDADSYDPTTQEYTNRRSNKTLNLYRSALRNYIWSASKERSGAVDLEGLNELERVFEPDTFYQVIRYWTDTSEDRGAIIARSAFSYVGNISTVLGRNDIDPSHMAKSMKTNDFLKEGKEAGDEMSAKTLAFCRPIVKNRVKRQDFLTQHIAYRARAEDLMATDKILSGDQLSFVRALGSCAAFAAIAIGGAPMRCLNTLQLRLRGTTTNIHLPNGSDDYFLLTVSAKEMKGNKRRVPPVKIRRNALEGAQTLEWYLNSIRPLFPFGNRKWCEGVDEPLDHVRFGAKLRKMDRRESIYFFVAPESADHLSKSLFYEQLVSASEDIGMPMTAHNFRHGMASILMSRSLANLHKVARMLNNTPDVVQKYYAWINEEAVIEETQDEILDEVTG